MSGSTLFRQQLMRSIRLLQTALEGCIAGWISTVSPGLRLVKATTIWPSWGNQAHSIA